MPPELTILDQTVSIIGNDGEQARNLYLLRVLDEHESWLSSQIKKYVSYAELFDSFTHMIQEDSGDAAYNEVVPERLEKLETTYKELIARINSEGKDISVYPDITDDEKERLLDLCDQSIQDAGRVVTTSQTLRWAILEHNADFDTTDGRVFDNAEDLIADLNS